MAIVVMQFQPIARLQSLPHRLNMLRDPNRRTHRSIIVPGALALIASACVFYAPLVLTYVSDLFGGNASLWDRVFASLTSSDYATGEGSVHREQRDVYTRLRGVMAVHTISAAGLFVLGPLQFSDVLRRRFRKSHRLSGYLYLALLIMTIVASVVFLVSTPMQDVFSGPSFALGLWSVAIMATLFHSLGLWAALQSKRDAHIWWMVFGYSVLLVTLVQRAQWIAFGSLMPDETVVSINRWIEPLLLLQVFTLASVAGAWMIRSRHQQTISARHNRHIRVLGCIVGTSCGVWVTLGFAGDAGLGAQVFGALSFAAGSALLCLAHRAKHKWLLTLLLTLCIAVFWIWVHPYAENQASLASLRVWMVGLAICAAIIGLAGLDASPAQRSTAAGPWLCLGAVLTPLSYFALIQFFTDAESLRFALGLGSAGGLAVYALHHGAELSRQKPGRLELSR